ncbi:MAG TPA: magnesium transporter CorA family protein [Steroidobacteraceae bacterium]|jgi:magnesium transporter|nr:magnesium transporter CorA family protein [Steroidobacteraceae bacterium]
MLHIYPPVPAEASSKPHRPVWIDLLRPTPDEEALVESEHGLRIPTHAQLSEIETSSRLRVAGHTLLMSMPLGLQDNRFASSPLPLGFVLTPDILITIRYCDIHAFPDVQATLLSNHEHGSSGSVFASLLEAMVDFAADRLEQISADLGGVSQRVFGSPAQPLAPRPRFNSAMQQNLMGVGQTGELLSRIRESLLGLGRIAGFTIETASWLAPDVHARLKTVRHDLASLSDYENHLSGKTQFLQDAVLGFINTQQNDIFKVLTIVSVVGVPPTLIASIYGMNFHNIPEYGWKYGYQYGLALIALSIVVPILWFKWRKWW